ncbi:DUF2971 domain-containing protein [Aliivibrio salmonicida]|uniref:DUF2971 domain-containing protein n=1 Tax=Aliivibrio salmonicida TaxID=40269 RepID=UPI00406C0CCB
MLLYRYRSASELSFKELIYNELYFASKEELNDPFDGESYYHFPPHKALWIRLLNEVNANEKEVMFDLPTGIDATHIDFIATALSQREPISFEEVMRGRLTDIFTDIVSEQKDINDLQKNIGWFSKAVQHYLSYHNPKSGCFVSLSATGSDHLMWGHYGAQHSGFSLIYRTIDGAIGQDPVNYKNSVDVSNNYSISVPNMLPCSKVEYSEKVDYHNACWLLPRHLISDLDCIDLSEIKNHWDKSDNFLSSKHISWEYEKEYRLILRGAEGLSSLNRLFHYDSSQLVGIVFGSKISDNNKKRIKEIVKHKKESRLHSNCASYSFPFVFFQADRSFNREIDIVADEVFDCNFDFQSEPNDVSLWLDRWEKGYALRFGVNGECKQVTIS